jgi:hypothetical protein
MLLVLATKTVAAVKTESAQLYSFKVQVLLSTFDRAFKTVSAQLSARNITTVRRHNLLGCRATSVGSYLCTQYCDLLYNAVLLHSLIMAIKQAVTN